MPHSKSGAVFTDLVLEVFRLNGALLAAGDYLTAGIGLTSARWQVMGTLDDRSLPVPHIAREMGLTRQGVQRTVNILAQENLVEFQDNPHHKTAKLVRLTSKGRDLLDQVDNIQANWANSIAGSHQVAELESALRTIQDLRTKIEEEQ